MAVCIRQLATRVNETDPGMAVNGQWNGQGSRSVKNTVRGP